MAQCYGMTRHWHKVKLNGPVLLIGSSSSGCCQLKSTNENYNCYVVLTGLCSQT